MGLEADCTMEWRGRSASGRALLETDELLFRGEVRLKIARPTISSVAAEGGKLKVGFGGDSATFTLGAAAEKWARALVIRKSRLDKLGVVPGLTVSVIGVDDAAFRDELRERIGAFAEGTPAEDGDLLFFGVRAAADLGRIATLKRTLKQSGALWVIHPKGQAEVGQAKLMAAGRGAGLVDVKVASFSPTHTAEKFVVPLAARKPRGKRESGRPTRA
jgi:hypothetical protein